MQVEYTVPYFCRDKWMDVTENWFLVRDQKAEKRGFGSDTSKQPNQLTGVATCF